MSELFSLHPWDMQRLTPGEFDQLRKRLEQLERDAKQAQRGARRGG